jgi:tRNA A-37 threonylcarbamoyl transferase component Bud32/tetratricopeptide (TPR) repeat protein
MKEWRDIDTALNCALDLDPAERAAWLAELATTDPSLEQTLRSMLARHERLDAEGFLAHSPVESMPRVGRAGTRVGAYLIERLLGRGGMGEVWLATRSDGRYEGKCALKFLDESVASARLVDRFRREGTFLARLTHPNIARLLDAGAVEGQPYLALEYVDGERLDQYCSQQALTVEQRVRLFVEVVAAVAHAHSHLIIHRDLKPSNVLVTREGQVKLLDFGIAKLLVPECVEGGDVTRLEDAALTPEYAAPEQMLGETPSTATDVYQLGLLLHALLTGTHPLGIVGTRAERIRAALDGVVPRANVEADLDAILDMALRRNPVERYSTAQALKEDLQRFLEHEPVAARRGAALYRARKFVQRHRVATFATTASAAALVLALLFALGQAHEAGRQRDTTRKELARATAVNDFATYLVSAAGPGDGKFTAAELLAASEALIDKQFPADGAVKAEILAMVGSQYLLAQRFDKAGPVLDRAASIAAPIGDPALNARVNCPRALIQAMKGNEPRQAVALIERTLAELPDAKEYLQLRADCYTRYSEFGQNNGLAEPAIRNAQAALALYAAQPGASVPRRIDAQAALAWGYYLAHDNEKADREFAAVAAALEATGRGRTHAAADVYANWALVHYRGDIRRAEPLTARALELRRYIEGAEGVNPNITFDRAGVLLLLGRFDEAAALYEETMRTAEARQRRSMLAYAAMEYADLKVQQGDLRAADSLLARANELMSAPEITKTNKAIMSYHLGMLAEAHGRAEAARAEYLAAVPAFEKMQEKVALNVYLYCGLSRVERLLGHAAASAKAADQALAVARLMAEPDSPSHVLGRALLVVGQSQQAAGNREESWHSFQRARENLENTLGPAHALSRQARALSVQ